MRGRAARRRESQTRVAWASEDVRRPPRRGGGGAAREPGAARRACVRASGTLRFARGRCEVRAMEEEKYLPELMAEKDSLDPSFVHASRLLAEGRTCPHGRAHAARRPCPPRLGQGSEVRRGRRSPLQRSWEDRARPWGRQQGSPSTSEFGEDQSYEI